MLTEAISIAKTMYDAYGMVSSIFAGNKTEKLLGNIEKHVERLSDHILYAPHLQSIRDITLSRQHYIDNLRDIRQGLEPVQKVIRSDIVSSAVIWTPDKTRISMQKNPWKLLNYVQPLSLATPPGDPNLVPVIFEHQGVQYIGWQNEGAIPILFDLEYSSKQIENILKTGSESHLPSRLKIAPSRTGKRELRGTQTDENLRMAFAGESMVYQRYLYFAANAKIEGCDDESKLFQSMAESRAEHGLGHMRFLEELGDPASGLSIGNVAECLKSAIATEIYEYSEMYPGMAKEARKEGFIEIADWFETLAKAERSHATRFQRILDNLG